MVHLVRSGTVLVKVPRAMTPGSLDMAHKVSLGDYGGETGGGHRWCVAGSGFTSRQENVNQDTILVIRENGTLEGHFGIERPPLSFVQPLLASARGNCTGTTNRSTAPFSRPVPVVALVMNRRARDRSVSILDSDTPFDSVPLKWPFNRYRYSNQTRISHLDEQNTHKRRERRCC